MTKFGKKQPIHRFDIIVENKNKIECEKCGGRLVKLETETEPSYEKKGKVYRNLYWICLCMDCRRKVKVLESSFEVDMESK